MTHKDGTACFLVVELSSVYLFPHPFLLLKHCVFFLSDLKHRPICFALRPVASIVVGLSGLLIAFHNDYVAEVEETSPGEFFSPAALGPL